MAHSHEERKKEERRTSAGRNPPLRDPPQTHRSHTSYEPRSHRSHGPRRDRSSEEPSGGHCSHPPPRRQHRSCTEGGGPKPTLRIEGRGRRRRAAARVYVAGPLFWLGETEVLTQEAATLEAAGFATFLPQRDGLELTGVVGGYEARGYSVVAAQAAASADIYAFDMHALWASDAIVGLVAGSEPDSGTVAELATAANALGIATVLYTAGEVRLFAAGTRLNPILAELSTLRAPVPGAPDRLSAPILVDRLAALPEAVRASLSYVRSRWRRTPLSELSRPLREAIRRGARLERDRTARKHISATAETRRNGSALQSARSRQQ